jgi:energy-coupling factor transporter ATP-binding protein EcfA2
VIVATARDLRFTHGGAASPALDGIDLDVAAGEILVLEGPSGEGKTTLLRALCGLVPHFHGGRFSGRVEIDGHDTLDTDPARICRLAGMVFQDPEGQAVLGSVARDVAFGLECAGIPAGLIPGRVDAALAGAGAAHLHDRAIATLSGGERQRVAIAGVLAPAPRVLLLDEPTSQLDDAAAAALMATLRALADGGTAIVVTEHRSDRVRDTADRVLTVRGGRLGGPEALADAQAPAEAVSPGPVRARIEGLSAGYAGRAVVRDAWLDLRAGEVTTLHGPNGCGKSTLLRVLAGLHPATGGRVLLDDEDVTGRPAERRFPALGFVGQDPGRHLLTERVDDEVGLALRGLPLARSERRERVARALGELDIAHLAGRHPLDLSVGQRERVAMAAVLAARPGVVALDEPTRGMDPARKAALAVLLRAMAADGAAVLIATHDAAFARQAGDRALVMRHGAPAPVAAPVPVAAP